MSARWKANGVGGEELDWSQFLTLHNSQGLNRLEKLKSTILHYHFASEDNTARVINVAG